MSRITDCFLNLKKKGRTALVPFITAGDPEPDLTVSLLHTLVKSGADIIELGVPFSDPMADGPVIQKSSERALFHGTSLADVLKMVTEFRKTNSETPIILMGYLNPIEVMGYEAFSEKANEAGVDGILVVDLPPEEADELQSTLKQLEIDQVFLTSPTTTDERLKQISSKASGFLYYVSLKGVTGSNKLDVKEVKNKVAHIQSMTDLPVGVGFGIKDAETARQIAGISDAVIVGSSLVERIANLQKEPEKMTSELSGFLSELRHAIDAT
jgi:tryptophan synthase alpha chain